MTQLGSLLNGYKKMVVNLSMGVIDEEDFGIFKTEYEKKKNQINLRINELQKRKENTAQYMTEYQRWLDHFLEYREITELSREVVINLIERINVYEDNRIEIVFRFQKPDSKTISETDTFLPD